jgi:hypothetical protein
MFVIDKIDEKISAASHVEAAIRRSRRAVFRIDARFAPR